MMNKIRLSTNSFNLCWLAITIFLLSNAATSYAQAVYSRDNHTGGWGHRSSWEQNWAGIRNSANINAEVHIKGYLVHGTSQSPADLSFSGPTAHLIVEDTLRIHGKLVMSGNAKVTIKPGGVLIVHGNYEQYDDVTFDNQGTGVFLSNWERGNNGTFFNTGNLYISGTVKAGGHVTNYKTYSELEQENPSLHYFSRINVIRTACEGNNTGTLTFEGSVDDIIRWESSLDFFLNDIIQIPNISGTLAYENLVQTTSYRVYLRRTGTFYYSGGASIIVLEKALGGSVIGPDEEFCALSNTGILNLTGSLGGVVRWEASTDGFETLSSSVTTANETLSFTNLSTTTSFRAVVMNGQCEEVYSSHFTVKVNPASQGGVVGDAELCKGDNSGELMLSEHAGDVIHWESSASSDFSSPIIIASTRTTLPYENLNETTYYRALVKNGACAEAYSAVATATVSEVKGGVLAGSTAVCKDTNSGTLSLQGYAGEIVRWESSPDNFQTAITTLAHSKEVLTFEGLTQTTSYRAVLSSGSCGEAYSAMATITVDQPAEGGNLTGGGATFCAGENEGSLQLEGYFGEIVRWERSTDGFENDITLIDHTAATLDFNNLTATTSYRALLQNGSCSPVYSSIATISIDQPAVAGTLQGGGIEVCAGDNQGQLTLDGFKGEIIRWEASVDNFISDIQLISHTGSVYEYTNLAITTSYRAVLANGSCGELYTETATIALSPQSEGGQITGSREVCKGINYGELKLGNYVGELLRWESSANSDFSSFNVIASTSTTLSYENLSQTTWYRAVIKSGACTEVYSSIATVTVSELSGGILVGSQTVCEGNNEGTLTLENYQGNILRWERSTDGFKSKVEPIAHTGSTYAYAGLTASYSYRVVIGASGCAELYSGIATIAVEPTAVGGTIAGGKRIIPGDNGGELRAEGQQGNILRWEKSTDNFTNDIQPVDHTESILFYENIEQDSWYRVLVSFENSCSPVYSSSAALLINNAPLVQDDQFSLSADQAVEGYRSEKSLLDNDMDPDGDPLLITSGQDFKTTAGNSLSVDERGYIYYVSAAGFTGTDSLQYSVCDVAGEASRCSYGYVILEISERAVVPDGKVVIYQGVSPNGDGLNDKWVIDNIEQYPDNLVQIFDRSGVLVYEIVGYDNTSRVFEGFRNKGFGTGSRELPESTYFYRVKLDKVQPLLRGYVILNR